MEILIRNLLHLSSFFLERGVKISVDLRVLITLPVFDLLRPNVPLVLFRSPVV